MFARLTSISIFFKLGVALAVVSYVCLSFYSLKNDNTNLKHKNNVLLAENSAFQSANQVQKTTISNLQSSIVKQDLIAVEQSEVAQQIVRKTEMVKQELAEVVREFEDEDNHSYINTVVPASIVVVLNEAASSDYTDPSDQRVSANFSNAALHDTTIHWQYERRLDRIHF